MSLRRLTFILSGSTLLALSCGTASKKDKKANLQEGSNQQQIVIDSNDDGSYRSKINFTPGSRYAYTITNESQTKLEVNGKKVDVLHKSDVGITYDIQKDSAGNYVIKLHYDKIHLYNKTGDKETDLDAANSAATFDPTEKMLGVLKEANILATVTSTGKVVAISGYKELGEKILSGFKDETSRSMAEAQWEKVIGEGMVKKSIEQLFTVLPESAKNVGDTWTKNTKQKGEIDMNVTSNFKLKDIEDGIATIESEGELTSEKGETSMMGYSVTSNMQGDQEGEYQVETNTGMVLKNNTTSTLKGSLQMMGKEIPVSIKITLTMNGKKVQ
jgi:hypothetical protein